MKRLNSTPKQDGFRMPGEFERHDGCYMIWPERPDNWRLGGKPAQAVFTKVANTIGKYEPLTMIVSKAQYSNARQNLADYVRVVEMSNDDSWCRDSGATFVINDKGEVRGVDWTFNAWGGLVDGLYFPWDQDDKVAQKMCELERVDSYRLDNFVLEGGSIHVDGEGTVMATEETLLSEGRNSHMTKEEIEKTLLEYLNCEKMLWIPRGIYNDETNGHVDNMCNFVKPGVVLLAWTDDENDPQYDRKLEIHKMHVPSPILITKAESLGVDAIDGTLPRQEGDRLAASYVNYYTGNGFIAVPVFNDPKDQDAVNLLHKLYPDRVIEPIYAREILLGGGNIHCITQQLPSGKK